MNSRKLLLTVLFAPLVITACKRSQGGDEFPPPSGPGAAPLPSLPTMASSSPASQKDMGELRATGATHALHQAELGPKGSGVLAAVSVEEGQRVKKGQVLFRLDATNASLGVKQAEAGLAQARVGLTQAELEYNRTKPLADQGTISPAVWDQVRLGSDRAKVGVQQAEAAVASARAYAGDATVTAPFAGIVARKLKTTGETVSMMPPTVVIVLQDISKIEIRVKLAESVITRIAAGQPMRVTFPSLNLTRDIPIDRINPSVDPLNRTVEVVGTLVNGDSALKAGMLVDVSFPSAGAKAPQHATTEGQKQ